MGASYGQNLEGFREWLHSCAVRHAAFYVVMRVMVTGDLTFPMFVVNSLQLRLQVIVKKRVAPENRLITF